LLVWNIASYCRPLINNIPRIWFQKIVFRVFVKQMKRNPDMDPSSQAHKSKANKVATVLFHHDDAGKETYYYVLSLHAHSQS